MEINTRHFKVLAHYSKQIGRERYAGWVRVFGRGLYWRVNPRSRSEWLYFSEREGFRSYVKLGRFVLGCLRKEN